MTKHQNRRWPALEPALAGALLLLMASIAGAAWLWSSAQMVGPDDRFDSDFASVEVSPDGTVWIVWGSADPVQGDSETYYVTISDFIQSPRQKIHEENRFMDRCPLMSMGSDGVPWVIWERYHSTLRYLQVVTHWTGDGWAPADTVFRLGSRWDDYTIHASNSSDVWVAKSSRAGGRADRDIYLRHWDGTSWSAIETVGFDGWEDLNAALTTDGVGRTWVAWLRYDMSGQYRNFVYAAARGDAGWGQPAPVDTTEGNQVVSSLSVCSDGRPIVLWMGGGQTTTSDIEYAVLEDTGWEYGGLVNKPDNVLTESDGAARLGRRSDGELWAIWTSSVLNESARAITASRWLGNGWGDEELVSAPDVQSLMVDHGPDIAVAADGRIWAVWERQQQSEPYDTDIYVAYRDVTTAIDVWGLVAEPEGGSVRFSWHSSPEAAQGGFHVWRADGEACPDGPGAIPAGAIRLTAVAIRDCTSCSFTDDTATAPGTYCYWLEQAESGVTFGPVSTEIPAASRVSFAASPNPAGSGVAFQVAGTSAAREIRIHTVGGRLVRALPVPQRAGSGAASETTKIHWDGTDALGCRVPSGAYYAVLREQGSAADLKRVRFILLR